MSLKRSTIVKAVTSAFKALGEIPESVTYRRTASAYNPATGTVVATNTDYVLSKMIFTRFENFEVDKQLVLASDVKAIIQQSELSIVPSTATDKVVRTRDGKIYNILRVSQDPAGATYTLQLRSPS